MAKKNHKKYGDPRKNNQNYNAPKYQRTLPDNAHLVECTVNECGKNLPAGRETEYKVFMNNYYQEASDWGETTKKMAVRDMLDLVDFLDKWGFEGQAKYIRTSSQKWIDCNGGVSFFQLQLPAMGEETVIYLQFGEKVLVKHFNTFKEIFKDDGIKTYVEKFVA